MSTEAGLAAPGKGDAGNSIDSGGKISLAQLPDVILPYLQSSSTHCFHTFHCHKVQDGIDYVITWKRSLLPYDVINDTKKNL